MQSKTPKNRTTTRILKSALLLLALVVVTRPCFVLGQLVSALVCGIHPPLIRWYPILNWAFFLCVMGLCTRFVWRCYLNGIRSVWKRILVWAILLVCLAINWFHVSLIRRQSLVAVTTEEAYGFDADIALDEDEDEARVSGVPLAFSIGGMTAEKPRTGERFVGVHLGFDSQRGKTWCQKPETDVFSAKGAKLMETLNHANILYSAHKDVLASSVLAAAAFPNMTGKRYVLLDNEDGKSETVRVLSVQSARWPSQWKGIEVSQAMLAALEEEESCGVLLFAESLEAFAEYPIRVIRETPPSVLVALSYPNHDVKLYRHGIFRELGNIVRSPKKVAERFQQLSLDSLCFMDSINWGVLSAFLSCFPMDSKIRLYVATSDRGILDGEAIAMATLETWSRGFLNSLKIEGLQDGRECIQDDFRADYLQCGKHPDEENEWANTIFAKPMLPDGFVQFIAEKCDEMDRSVVSRDYSLQFLGTALERDDLSDSNIRLARTTLDATLANTNGTFAGTALRSLRRAAVAHTDDALAAHVSSNALRIVRDTSYSPESRTTALLILEESQSPDTLSVAQTIQGEAPSSPLLRRTAEAVVKRLETAAQPSLSAIESATMAPE